jgi:hypothetical protein
MGGRTSTSWKPGRSANPGGRPKNVVNVQELARSFTEAAIETLAKALADPKLRVQAAVAILDRGWGKPTQVIAGDGAPVDHWSLHLVAAKTIAAELRVERETLAIEAQPHDVTSEPPVDLAAPALE